MSTTPGSARGTASPPASPENLAAYLGKLTRHNAIDRWRMQHSKKRGGDHVTLALDELSEILPAGGSPEQAALDAEQQQAIDRFLASLPVAERNVFLCRYWYFDSVGAISESFGYSQSKTKSMLHRTRKKLRLFLQKEELL